MRVCLISSVHPWVNPRLIKEADALADRGHEVFVVTKRVDRWSDERDVQLLAGKPWSARRIGMMRDDPSDRWRWFSSAVRAELALRAYRAAGTGRLAEEAYYRGFQLVLQAAIDTRADFFIAHTQGALPIAARAAARGGVGFGFDCEDLLAEEMADGLRQPALRRAILDIERTYLPKAAYVTATSHAMAAYLAELYGIPEPSVIYNVFPRAEFDGLPPPVGRPRRDTLELAWISATIGPGRGLEDAVLALARLPEAVRLTIFGRMLPSYEPQLRALADGAGVRGRVSIQPIPHPQDVAAVIAMFDVGLSLDLNDCANRSLTICNKVFEYLQAGLVVGMTDTPGQRELIETVPSAGFVYPPGDDAALAAHLRPLVGDRRALVAAQTSRLGRRPRALQLGSRSRGVHRGVRARRRRAVVGRARGCRAMKRVVLVAPEFPPSNTAGAHRPRLFAKHLPEFGWTPTVLTIRRDQIEGPARSDARASPRSGARRRADGRSSSPAPSRHRRHRHPVAGPPRVGVERGHAARRSAGHRAVRAAMVFLHARSADAPLGRDAVCRGLHRSVDLRLDGDARVSQQGVVLPSRRRGHRARRASRGVHVTAVSERHSHGLRARYPWLDPGRTTSMPYGAEPDDIDAAVSAGLAPPDFRARDGAFNVCFTGAISEAGLLRAVAGRTRVARRRIGTGAAGPTEVLRHEQSHLGPGPVRSPADRARTRHRGRRVRDS